ncbi:uncharacterized protein LOC113153379 [Anabas testudineus]|uniref:uncharacterized protein LOC113153379 n=1 Tax=Anabas testudineus TaxID=64144 RepID=UPI000E45F22E|nr:uncharacterized protein LOC113153379 [Anabas testudineus]
MTPQLYITVYKQHFTSPGRVKRTQLRPTSAHRRNNPQPRPDFLFPWSLQPNYRSTKTHPRPSPPVGSSRPLFPPVRHLSFHSPVTASPNNCLSTAAEQALPSADRLKNLHFTEPNAAQLDTALKNPQRRMDYQMNVHPLSARQRAGVHLQTRPQTGNSPAVSHHFPCIQNCRSRCNSALDHSSCYSCFHVVKPYQAGHYIIHPEFVSESLS